MRRRAFLQFLGMAPVAGPIAAKGALEAVQAGMAGVATAPFGPSGGVAAEPTGYPPNGIDETAMLRQAYKLPGLRDELTSLIYQEHRRVGFLDPDIANKRSFSLAAKITFQRQREVERGIEARLAGDEGRFWWRWNGILQRVMGPFGGYTK
jgi:hypothetical protein